MSDALQPWMDRWGLTPDGAAFRTASSWLAPVRWHGRAAMLKLATVEEERFGNGLMVCWAGDGAAEVFAHDGPALLMARGGTPLLTLFCDGREAEGVAALSATLRRLHRPRADPPEAIALGRRFASLFAAEGEPFGRAARLARRLLDAPRDEVILHGDAHPGNVLDFGGQWLAVDPKRLLGERAFDHTHLFVTPDLGRSRSQRQKASVRPGGCEASAVGRADAGLSAEADMPASGDGAAQMGVGPHFAEGEAKRRDGWRSDRRPASALMDAVASAGGRADAGLSASGDGAAQMGVGPHFAEGEANVAWLDRLLTLVAASADLDRTRLRAWIAASAALSAAWSVEDDQDPGHALRVTEWALAAL